MRWIALTATVIAAMLWGCGGEDSDGKAQREGGISPEAKRAYIAEADRICARALDDARAIAERAMGRFDEAGGSPIQATTKLLIEPGIAVRKRQAEELLELEAPGEDSNLERYLGLFATIDELSHQRLVAGRRGDTSEAMRLEAVLRELGEEQQQAAAAFGFDECAKDVVFEALK
jgi:hypothetical protein